MRKLIVALCSIVCLSVAVQAIDVQTIADIPNLRACSYYDFNAGATGIGMESSLLRYKAFDLCVGYVRVNEVYSGTASLSVNLDKLNVPGLEYAWKDFVHTSVGIWGGYSVINKSWSVGVNASLISLSK